jgi:hypothetical protein
MSAFKRLLIGSTATRLARTCPVPAMTVSLMTLKRFSAGQQPAPGTSWRGTPRPSPGNLREHGPRRRRLIMANPNPDGEKLSLYLEDLRVGQRFQPSSTASKPSVSRPSPPTPTLPTTTSPAGLARPRRRAVSPHNATRPHCAPAHSNPKRKRGREADLPSLTLRVCVRRAVAQLRGWCAMRARPREQQVRSS